MDRNTVSPYLAPMTPEPTPWSSAKGHLKTKVKCLLCDIYGTLLQSGSGDIGVAQKQEPRQVGLGDLLTRYKIKCSQEELRQELYAAIKKAHELDQAKGIDFPEVAIDRLWADILPFGEPAVIRKFAVEWEMVMNPVWPMPGLEQLLFDCRSNGILLGIISNAQFFTPLLFDWLLGHDLQDLGFNGQLTFLSHRHGRAKPSPFLFELAVEALEERGIAPSQTAYIGNDMRNDIIPAQQIGFQTILFAGDGRSLRMRSGDPHCRNHQPDLRINHLNQLASFLLND